MLEVVVFAEDRAGFEAATILADRVICTALPWAVGNLESLRAWRGSYARDFNKWAELAGMWREQRPNRQRQLHGRYNAPEHKGQKGEYVQARKALLLAKEIAPASRAVLLIRDSDGRDRAADLRRAVRGCTAPHGVVAVPEPESEAWYVAGFEPRGDGESAMLRALLAGMRRPRSLSPSS